MKERVRRWGWEGGRGETRGDGEVKRGGIDRIEKLKRIT